MVLYCNWISLRNYYFHFMEIRFSADQRVGKHCYGHVIVIIYVTEQIWLPRNHCCCVACPACLEQKFHVSYISFSSFRHRQYSNLGSYLLQ